VPLSCAKPQHRGSLRKTRVSEGLISLPPPVDLLKRARFDLEKPNSFNRFFKYFAIDLARSFLQYSISRELKQAHRRHILIYLREVINKSTVRRGGVKGRKWHSGKTQRKAKIRETTHSRSIRRDEARQQRAVSQPSSSKSSTPLLSFSNPPFHKLPLFKQKCFKFSSEQAFLVSWPMSESHEISRMLGRRAPLGIVEE
jgi:hypothetical protein